MSATLRLVLSTLLGFLFGFLVGAFMFTETVNPEIQSQVVLMGFVWILFSWIGGRLSYSITRDTIEKEEWEAAAQRRYDLNRLEVRAVTGLAVVYDDAVVRGEGVVYGGEREQNRIKGFGPFPF